MIARLFYSQLPYWARPTYPIMRYALGYKNNQRRSALLSLLLLLLVGGLMVVAGYIVATQNTVNDSPGYREVLYYPLVAGTLLMQLWALAITTNAVALERQRGTWESLRITLRGAPMTIRARWALPFYRARWLLAAIFLARLVYIGLLLYDMTDFEGRAIDVRIIGVTPEVSIEVAVFILAGLMTAAILQPFVALGFDSALGMLVGTLTQRRTVGILTTAILMAGRAVLTLGAVYWGSTILDANGTTSQIVEVSGAQAWLRLLLLATQGDQSLRLLSLESLGTIWADVPNGVYIGLVVLGLVILQAVAANLFVLFAAWWSARPGKS
jgi:hypothetical protein